MNNTPQSDICANPLPPHSADIMYFLNHSIVMDEFKPQMTVSNLPLHSLAVFPTLLIRALMGRELSRATSGTINLIHKCPTSEDSWVHTA